MEEITFRLFSFLTSCMLCFINLSAQEIPVLKNVQIKAEIGYDSGLQIFTYTYTVTNPLNSTGGITDIQIDISIPTGGRNVSSEGLTISYGINRRGVLLTRSFEEELSTLGSSLKKPVVPVGTRTPDHWGSYISVAGTVGWGSKGEYDIMPGKSLTGFVIFSRGLPAIRSVEMRPFWVLSVKGYVTEEDVEKSKQIKEQITFKGKTIGPTAPPADFKPIAFLSYIISLKEEAFTLGWIKNKGIENSLDVKLENARKKLEAGDTKTARNILHAFINEVEAQNGKHLTSEAYALLYYNAKYLIEHLQ